MNEHNEKIKEAIFPLINNRTSFAIIDKGRSKEERSCIWVEQGHFYGMGYITSDIGFTTPEEIKEFVSKFPSNNYLMRLITSYAEKHPSKIFQIE